MGKERIKVDVLSWLGVAVAWLVVGWLPSRINKHYFVSAFGWSLGEEAWTWRDEAIELMLALGGPFRGASLILWWPSRKRPRVGWGWKW